MITTRQNGFYQVDDEAHVPCVGIESDRLAYCVEGINQRQLKGVFCSPYHRFSENHLNFLKAIPDIEALLLRDTTLDDIDAIYSVDRLQYLRCNHKRPPIDFSRLQNLKTAVIEPVSRDSGLHQLHTLEKLVLMNYRPRTRDFGLMPLPTSITELQLHWMNLTTLKALPDLPNLQRLEIIHCKNLTDLALDLERFPKLEHLLTKACIKIPEQTVEAARKALAKLPSLSIEEDDEH